MPSGEPEALVSCQGSNLHTASREIVAADASLATCLNATDGDDSGSHRTTERRTRELRTAVERAHASDRCRVQSGELRPTELFWISEEVAKRTRVRWPDRCRAKV